MGFKNFEILICGWRCLKNVQKMATVIKMHLDSFDNKSSAHFGAIKSQILK